MYETKLWAVLTLPGHETIWRAWKDQTGLCPKNLPKAARLMGLNWDHPLLFLSQTYQIKAPKCSMRKLGGSRTMMVVAHLRGGVCV